MLLMLMVGGGLIEADVNKSWSWLKSLIQLAWVSKLVEINLDLDWKVCFLYIVWLLLLIHILKSSWIASYSKSGDLLLFVHTTVNCVQ